MWLSLLYDNEPMYIDINKYEAVIFDFDNTLYAPNHLGRRIVFSDIFNLLKARKDRLARRELKGKDFNNSQAYYQAYFELVGEKNRDWYFNRYLPLMVKLLKKGFNARPKAQELINWLEENNVRVGVYSDYPMVRERCEAVGLQLPNDRLWCSESFGALKPAARPFIEIAKKLGASPEKVLVVGDRPDTDLAGAKAAGMDCILVKTKKNETEPGVVEWEEIVQGI